MFEKDAFTTGNMSKSLMPVEISTEVGACYHNNCTLQWVVQNAISQYCEGNHRSLHIHSYIKQDTNNICFDKVLQIMY